MVMLLPVKAATEWTGGFQRLENCALGAKLAEKVTLSSVTWQLASAPTHYNTDLISQFESAVYKHAAQTD